MPRGMTTTMTKTKMKKTKKTKKTTTTKKSFPRYLLDQTPPGVQTLTLMRAS
jgi:hypothetical protein